MFAITLTLMMRPLGAFIFGWLGDRFGRRIPLMIDIVFYSVVELLTAFAPNFGTFLLLRALFGIGMGGEWGLGASLAMESLPTPARGLFSGILQQGYAFGYLLAALVYWIVFPIFGWRGLFVAGALPALLVIYIRAHVPESPVWGQRGIDDRHRLCHRHDLWRHCDQFSFATMGPSPLYYFIGGLWDAFDPGVDFRTRDNAAHCRRISHAIHGARCMGSGARAFKRTFAGRVPRNISRTGISAGEFRGCLCRATAGLAG